MTNRRILNNLPTTSTSRDSTFLRILLQMSMVNKADAELKMEIKSETNADNITAIMRPRTPDGRSSMTNLGYVMSVHPRRFSQSAKQTSGSEQAISSAETVKLMKSRRKGRKNHKDFKYSRGSKEDQTQTNPTIPSKRTEKSSVFTGFSTSCVFS